MDNQHIQCSKFNTRVSKTQPTILSQKIARKQLTHIVSNVYDEIWGDKTTKNINQGFN